MTVEENFKNVNKTRAFHFSRNSFLTKQLFNKQNPNKVKPRQSPNTKEMAAIKINGAKTSKLYFGNGSNHSRGLTDFNENWQP